MGLPNCQMVFNICFIPKGKQTYNYEQYPKNNILSVLKTLQYKIIHIIHKLFHEKSTLCIFNKLAELDLAISSFPHKHKSHFLVSQMCGYTFRAVNRPIV